MEPGEPLGTTTSPARASAPGVRGAWRPALAATLVAALLAGCATTPPGTVKRPPPLPPRRAEIAPVAPSRAHVWVPGAWAWHRERYVWVPGRWEVPAAKGLVWVPGGWMARDGRYVWVDGHWRAR